jgi:hypothetical protein
MKRDWDLHELIEHWTLVPRELELLRNKTGATRLGYAVSLNFFQQTAQLSINMLFVLVNRLFVRRENCCNAYPERVSAI